MATTVALNAVETNIRQFIGVDHEYVFTEADGNLLTGFTLSFMVKADKEDDDAAAIITITSITIAGAVATIQIADTDTADFDPDTYYWELKRMDPGAETILGFGEFVLIRGVHRE